MSPHHMQQSQQQMAQQPVHHSPHQSYPTPPPPQYQPQYVPSNSAMAPPATQPVYQQQPQQQQQQQQQQQAQPLHQSMQQLSLQSQQPQPVQQQPQQQQPYHPSLQQYPQITTAAPAPAPQSFSSAVTMGRLPSLLPGAALPPRSATCNIRWRHARLMCNRCMGDLVGLRLSCPQCFSYDLCEKCAASRAHRHTLVAVWFPLSRRCYDYLLANLSAVCKLSSTDKATLAQRGEAAENLLLDLGNITEVHACAMLGHERSQLLYACSLAYGPHFSGTGVDKAQAEILLQFLARANHPLAIYCCLNSGYGVSDSNLAVRQLDTHGDKNDYLVQYTFAHIVAQRHPDQQLVWLERAAAKRFAPAKVDLALLILKTDRARAVDLLQQAVQVGCPRALCAMGVLLCKGVAVPKDHAQGVALLQQSVAQGFEKASEKLREVLGGSTGAAGGEALHVRQEECALM
eukprot:TRINITY_DN2573_c1_g2_i1.p1 TRINITY_DN2573_c1_g2~~TRINITY_DN2573_c1_g2_i1.p1  ORF type:complete len:506 (+),score=140.42 TRINITY_DN2573_c1_g2_i1:145-1518(+)